MNESIPASIGAIIVVLIGSVSLSDLGIISNTISGAAITIMATIVMAIVLESFGFFNWMAEKLAERAKGINHPKYSVKSEYACFKHESATCLYF